MWRARARSSRPPPSSRCDAQGEAAHGGARWDGGDDGVYPSNKLRMELADSGASPLERAPEGHEDSDNDPAVTDDEEEWADDNDADSDYVPQNMHAERRKLAQGAVAAGSCKYLARRRWPTDGCSGHAVAFASHRSDGA